MKTEPTLIVFSVFPFGYFSDFSLWCMCVYECVQSTSTKSTHIYCITVLPSPYFTTWSEFR